MDRVRYVLAVIGWISIPPAVLYWFIVHPFVDVWRRVGKPVTFGVLSLFYVACMVALWRVRGPVLATEYGSNPWLWPAAAVCYAGAIWIQTKIRKQLRFRVLAGSPELDRDGKGGALMDTGLYARVRHPRYLAVMLGVLAWALFTNYLAMYVLVPLTGLGIVAIIRFEERELLERFGEPYRRYRERVPMLFPHTRAG